MERLEKCSMGIRMSTEQPSGTVRGSTLGHHAGNALCVGVDAFGWLHMHGAPQPPARRMLESVHSTSQLRAGVAVNGSFGRTGGPLLMHGGVGIDELSHSARA